MTFRLQKATLGGRELRLSIDPLVRKNAESNYCTILIGRNGVGKSRFLAELCRVFEAFQLDGKLPDTKRRHGTGPKRSSLSSLSYVLRNTDVDVALNRSEITEVKLGRKVTSTLQGVPVPRKVIATTITPFDKFPFRSRRLSAPNLESTDDPNTIYQYLGPKNQAGQVSSRGYLNRVIDALMGASEKTRYERSRLNGVFDFLGYEPHIAVEYEIRTTRRQMEDIRRLGRDQAREWLLRSRFTTNPYTGVRRRNENDWNELVDAAVIVGRHSDGRWLNINLDLWSGAFYAGSLEVYRAAQSLRAAGVLSLSDLRLTRKSAGRDELSISDASSGEQAIALTMLGIGSVIDDDCLVIIDEPEISLHPEWQQKFVALLASTFSGYRGCHFLLATHSPLIVAQGGELPCAVVMMDEFAIHDALEFRKRSADFQLAEVFETPGYRNEYLAREALAALRLAGRQEYDSEEFQRLLELLVRARPNLMDDDPVAELADAVITAARMGSA